MLRTVSDTPTLWESVLPAELLGLPAELDKGDRLLREQETRKAMAAAEQIVVKAHEAAVQDHDQMLAELKREVGRLVVDTTAAVTGKILTTEDQRRLAEETARQLTA